MDDIFAFPERVDLKGVNSCVIVMIVDIMGGYLRRNAPRGSSANWTEVVKEYKQGVQQDIELSDDGIVAFEDDSNTSTDDSLLSSSSCIVC